MPNSCARARITTPIPCSRRPRSPGRRPSPPRLAAGPLQRLREAVLGRRAAAARRCRRPCVALTPSLREAARRRQATAAGAVGTPSWEGSGRGRTPAVATDKYCCI